MTLLTFCGLGTGKVKMNKATSTLLYLVTLRQGLYRFSLITLRSAAGDLAVDRKNNVANTRTVRTPILMFRSAAPSLDEH